MHESPEVAIIQHVSDVMQVAHHYFEVSVEGPDHVPCWGRAENRASQPTLPCGFIWRSGAIAEPTTS